VREGMERAEELLKSHPEVTEIEMVEEQLKVTLKDHESDATFIATVLVHDGLKLEGLREDELGLEEVFMRVTRGDTQ